MLIKQNDWATVWWKKLWRYVKPFSSDTGTLRTDRRTDLLYQYRASVCWRAIKTNVASGDNALQYFSVIYRFWHGSAAVTAKSLTYGKRRNSNTHKIKSPQPLWHKICNIRPCDGFSCAIAQNVELRKGVPLRVITTVVEKNKLCMKMGKINRKMVMLWSCAKISSFLGNRMRGIRLWRMISNRSRNVIRNLEKKPDLYRGHHNFPLIGNRLSWVQFSDTFPTLS